MQIRNSNVASDADVDVTKVDASAQIGFFAYRNSALTMDAEWTKIIFDTEISDYGSNYDTSTGKFTCDIAGRYLFNCCITFTSIADGSRTALWVYVNGSGYARLADGGVGRTGICTTGNSIMIPLDVDDYVEIWAFQNDAAGEDIQVGNAPYNTWFQGFKLA